LLLHQLRSGLKDELISHYSGRAVVNTTVAGEAVGDGLGQLTKFQFIV
jgi:hypothetical protein